MMFYLNKLITLSLNCLLKANFQPHGFAGIGISNVKNQQSPEFADRLRSSHPFVVAPEERGEEICTFSMFLTKGFSTSALCRSPSLLGRLTLPRTRVRRRGNAFKFAFSDRIQILSRYNQPSSQPASRPCCPPSNWLGSKPHLTLSLSSSAVS